jgi:phosphatidylserine decarboxylase
VGKSLIQSGRCTELIGGGLLDEVCLNKAAEKQIPYCIAEWLPSDQDAFARWMDGLDALASGREAPLHPVVRDFGAAVERDPALFALVHRMFDEAPPAPPHDVTPATLPAPRDFFQLLKMIDVLLTTPTFYNNTGLAGLPLNAMITSIMATDSGYTFFLDPTVNAHLKRILQTWGAFLASPASLPALSDDPRTGWFGADAMAHMPQFDTEYACTPDAPHRGFASWDDFFTRCFRPGQRPLAAPDDDAVIVSPCEAAPYKLAQGARLVDRFWIKAQPYSVRHMLADDDRARQFDGGTVYQAFLSSFSYHRWHSPVSGRIVKTQVVDGTYYAQNRPEGYDDCGPRRSQGYITQLATRALVFIEADHADIGLMCFMAVGMAEVSTCEITVQAGQRVAKGEQIGMFHFGGSTCCLLFRPETLLDFDLHGQTPGLDAKPIPVNARVATVRAPHINEG